MPQEAYWNRDTAGFSHTFPESAGTLRGFFRKLLLPVALMRDQFRTPGRTGYDLSSQRPFAVSGMYAEMSPLWLFNHYCEPRLGRSSRKLLPLGHCCCHLRSRRMQRTRFGKEDWRKLLPLPCNVCRSSLLFENLHTGTPRKTLTHRVK